MKNKIILFILFSISLLWAGPSPDLTIKKVASPQYIEGDSTINYFIVITNTSNANNPPDYNITVTDNIDEDFLDGTNTTLADYNLTIIDDGNLSCAIDINNSNGEIICDGLMIGGGARVIQYSLRAPNHPTQITNTASLTVTGFNDFNIFSSVTVTVFPSFENLDYVRDLCYEAPEFDQTCFRAGGFYYGSNCDTSVVIRNQKGNDLRAVQIFKAYTSTEIYKDDCYVDTNTDANATCTTNQTLDELLHVQSSTYLENAFETVLNFNFGDIAPDENHTIFDINARSIENPNNNADQSIDYIVLIAQYQRDDITNINEDNTTTNTVEEYIYPCDSGYGIPPKIVQTTAMQVNDVDMSSATLSTLNQAVYIPYGSSGNGYKKVGTKIVKQPFVMGLTYLDSDGNPSTYTGVYLDAQGNSDTIDASVLINYPGGDENHDALWAGKFAPATTSMLTLTETDNALITTQEYPQINEAFRDATLEIKFTDYSNFFNELGGYNCSTSVTQSSLCLVPACLNSDVKILEIFPIESYPKVAVCVYGDGGGAAPCDSNAYTGHCGGIKETISPADYNHDLGCAECLADATTPISTSDTFAVRPYSYSYSIINDDGDDPYRAGKNYPIEINATTADNDDPQSDFYRTDLVGYNPPTVIAAIGLDYNASLSCPYDTNESQSINFGILAGGDDNADATLGGYADNDINYIKYSNVGVTTLTIMDQEWTLVDQNGTDTDNYECLFDDNITDPSGDPFGRVGCRLMLQEPMTFVPHHFGISAALTNHNTIANFTYLNDFNATGGNPNMGAALDINITAVNQDGNTTTNYIDGCYARNNDLNLTFDPFYTAPLTKILYYHVADGNISGDDLNTPGLNFSISGPWESTQASGFEPNAPDGNGTNYSEYKLNFDRNIDQVVQAFAMNLTDVNMTDADNVEGNQTGITGQTAFMHYAKARPSVGISLTYTTKAEVALTPILIHVYCDTGGAFSLDYVSCTDLGITSSGAWGISSGHNANIGDGNVTLKVIDPPVDVVEGSGTPSLAYTKISIIADGKDDNLTVNRGPNPTFPLTVNIKLDATSDAWLIHNPFSLPIYPSPFYKVKFISPSIWAGPGGTGSVVDTEVNTNSNKRSNW